MHEKTIVKTMPLPGGQKWALYPDANMVVLSPCLDEAGRELALSEVQAHWRRSCIRVVPEPVVMAPEPNRVAPGLPPPMSARDAQPVATLSQVGR